MNFKRIFLAFICSFAMLLCTPPTVASAATVSEDVLMECQPDLVTASEIAVNSTIPVCDHRDPKNPLYPHSTMRYIRTVDWYNYVESRYDVREWYQCTLCGYETFWVHEWYN